VRNHTTSSRRSRIRFFAFVTRGACAPGSCCTISLESVATRVVTGISHWIVLFYKRCWLANCVVVITECSNSNQFQYQWNGRPNKTLKSNVPRTRFAYEKIALRARFFLWQECAAGKTYARKCLTGKIFWTESWWVLCPVDVVCKSLFTNYRVRIVFLQWINDWINLWINEWIKLGPTQSTFVRPTV